MSGILDILGGDIVKTVGSVITDLVTTDKERIQLAQEDKKIDQQGDLAQIEVNKTEAQSAHLFVSGWRPAIGWAGAMGVWCAFVPKAIVITALWAYTAWVLVSRWDGSGAPPALPVFPDLGIIDLLGLLGSLLGVGWMRHKETLAGVARSGLPAPSGPVPPNPYAQQEVP